MTTDAAAGQAPAPFRLQGIEAARFALCYAVILLHITDPPTLPWQRLTVAACNAAVPFFFITSGYFNRIEPGSSLGAVVKPAWRLCVIYAVWLMIYYGFIAVESGARPSIHARDLIDGGRAYHLWFLPALAFATMLVGLGFRQGLPRVTIAVCVALALLGVAPRLFEHAVPPFPGTRALAAPLYVVGGKLLSRRPFAPRPLAALSAAVLFWLLSFADGGGLVRLAGRAVTVHSAPLMTVGLGFAVFVLARSLSDGRAVRTLASLGGVSLGIYSVHLLILALVMPHASATSAPAVFVRAALVLALSTLLAAAIASLPFCWRLASHRRQSLSLITGTKT